MKRIIRVDGELAEIIPAYLEHRREDLARLPALMAAEDFDALRGIGHKLRGSGGGYGLDPLTEIGERMENAAKAKDKTALEAQAKELKGFLEDVQVEFVPDK
jgi:HPt (histidine-containing phosphotransfer) domain-containing protein